MSIRYVTLNGQTHEISSESLRGLGEWGWDISQEVINGRSGVNVKSYGALGDGTTDDTVAFQDAIDDAIATGRKNVFIPSTENFYRLTAGLSWGSGDATTDSDNVRLVGEGLNSHLKWDAAFAGDCVSFTGNVGVALGLRYGTVIQSLQMTCQNVTNKLIHATKFNNFILQDCQLNGPYLNGNNYGVYLDFGTNETHDWATAGRILNNSILGFKFGINGNYGANENKVTGQLISGNFIIGTGVSGSIGVASGASAWFVVNNCSIELWDYGIRAGSECCVMGNRFEDITTFDIAPRTPWPDADATTRVKIAGNAHTTRAKAFSIAISVGFAPWQNSISTTDVAAPYSVIPGLTHHYEANDVSLSTRYGSAMDRYWTYTDVYNHVGDIAAYSGVSPGTTNGFNEAITRPEFNINTNYMPFKLGTYSTAGRIPLSLYANGSKEAELDGTSFKAGGPGAIIRHASGTIAAAKNGQWAVGDRYYYTNVSVGGPEGEVCTTAGAFADSAWGGTTNYYLGAIVSNDSGKRYKCVKIAPSTGNLFGISAGSGGPTGTGSGITDNQLTWDYVAAADPTFTEFGSVSYSDGVFNVKSYGAAGDGTTDDTTAIQAAITACNAASGGVVFFPAGTYAVSLATSNYCLNIGYSNMALVGETGSVIKLTSDAIALLCDTVCSNLTIKNLKVTSAGYGYNDAGIITLNKVTNLRVENVEVACTTFVNSGVKKIDGITCSQGTTGVFKNCYVTGCPKTAFYISTGSLDVLLEGCKATYTVGYTDGGVQNTPGFGLASAGNTRLIGCVAHNCSGDGFAIQYVSDIPKNSQLIGCSSYSNSVGLGIRSAHATIVPTDVLVSGMQVHNNTTYGILVEAGLDLVFDNPMLYNNGIHGMYIINALPGTAEHCHRVLVNNPYCKDNATAITENIGAIGIDDMRDVTVNGGTFIKTTSTYQVAAFSCANVNGIGVERVVFNNPTCIGTEYVETILSSGWSLLGATGAAAPTTREWSLGTRVHSTAPAAGGYEGWICTTAGSFDVYGGAVTCTTDGTTTVTLSASETAFAPGRALTINGTNVTVVSNSGTTMVVSATIAASGPGTAIIYTVPVFKTFGAITA